MNLIILIIFSFFYDNYQLKFTLRGGKGVASFDFGISSTSNYGQGEISTGLELHGNEHRSDDNFLPTASPVSPISMSSQSNGEQVLITHKSPKFKHKSNFNVVNIKAPNITPAGDSSDSDFDEAQPPPPPTHIMLNTGDSNLNYNSDAHSHANSLRNIHDNHKQHYRNQVNEDLLNEMQHEFLSEEINDAEDRIKRGNYKLTDGSVPGEQMRATAGGPLSVDTDAINIILPASPEDSEEGPIPAPPPPPIDDEEVEDSDDSLYQKQHLFLQEEVNRKEDEEEEQMNLKMAQQMTDDGSGMNVTPM